jgi:DNA (cytosine-5)-methyltransferase 1
MTNTGAESSPAAGTAPQGVTAAGGNLGGLSKLRVLDLFSGIGGFSLGLERTGGFETVAFCEIEPFPRRVLAKHWPGVPCYEDVRTLTADTLARDGICVDVICGGFPCQDISIAGGRAGLDGTRSGLWAEIARLVRELRPSYVVVENVANLLSGPAGEPGGWFGQVLGDLAECRYDAEWRCFPASELGAPHHRERIWVVSYPHEVGRDGPGRYLERADDFCQGWQRVATPFNSWRDVEHWLKSPNADAIWATTDRETGRVDDGVSRGLDRDDIGALGNAVVPQIPELIGRAILAAEAAA